MENQFESKETAMPSYRQPEQYIKCPHCRELALLDPQVYTSMPPQYRYHCSHCGESGYIFCSDARIIVGDSETKPWWGAPKTAIKYKIKCIICGEETECYGETEHPFVCPECQEAVIAMRKALGTWND